MDLFCAALTTLCELILPLIMRYITNEGISNLAALSVETIVRLGILYLLLRIIECAAGYYMADMGAEREYVPGRSTRTNRYPPCSNSPSLASTVTPL